MTSAQAAERVVEALQLVVRDPDDESYRKVFANALSDFGGASWDAGRKVGYQERQNQIVANLSDLRDSLRSSRTTLMSYDDED